MIEVLRSLSESSNHACVTFHLLNLELSELNIIVLSKDGYRINLKDMSAFSIYIP